MIQLPNCKKDVFDGHSLFIVTSISAFNLCQKPISKELFLRGFFGYDLNDKNWT